MSAAELIGTILDDRFRLVDVIGVGGMGTVFAAEHLKLGRTVAVKMLRDEFKGDAGLRARFMAEARAMAEIGHEHIVRVIDIGTAPNGSLYFVMEHLRGEDLADTLAREGRLAWLRVRSIGLQLCLALAASHDKKIVHRDLKPSNCFMLERIDGGDYVKILDFGIAKMLADEGRRVPDSHGLQRVDSRRWQHTVSGEVYGTMAYMSPEHFFGEAVDHRTDVYALGVILYELLTGVTPLAADNIGNFAEELRYLDPTPPSKAAPDAKIPADMDYLVLRALAKKPEDRFASMKDLGVALAEARADRPVQPLQTRPVVGGDSGSATMVWSRPEAQAALKSVLPAKSTRWVRGWAIGSVVIVAIVAAVIGRVVWGGEAVVEAVVAPAVREPTARHEPQLRAPALPRVEVPAAPGRAAVVEPVAMDAVRAARCPPVTKLEWARIFEPVVRQIAACRQTWGIKPAMTIAVDVGVAGGKLTAREMQGQSGKMLAAVRCVRKLLLAARLKLPAKLQSCRMAPAAQYF